MECLIKKKRRRNQSSNPIRTYLTIVIERPCAGGSKGLRKTRCFQVGQILMGPPKQSNIGSFKILPKLPVDKAKLSFLLTAVRENTILIVLAVFTGKSEVQSL